MTAKKTSASRKTQVNDGDKNVFDPKAYNAVVKVAELGQIVLTECKFNITADYFKHRKLGKSDRKGLKYSYGCNVNGLDFSPEQDAVGANFDWTLLAKSGRINVLKLYCSYVCFYSGVKDANEAAAKAFAERVGKFATYPYFRAFASQISWASDADLPILSVLRESKRPSEKKLRGKQTPKRSSRKRPTRRA